MKTSKLNLDNHPTLFDLSPYTISLPARIKRAAVKAVEAVKSVAKKAVEKVTEKKAEHPTLFNIKPFTLSLEQLRELAQKKIDALLLRVVGAKVAAMPEIKLPTKKVDPKPAPYNPEAVRNLAEALLAEALHSLKALAKKAIPSRREIEELREFFESFLPAMQMAEIGDGVATQRIVDRILGDAEDRLLAA